MMELHAIFMGQVQGVFFRAMTQKFAKELGLVGEVKNRSDGSVELIAQGSKESLEILLEKLQSPSGPGSISSITKTFRPSKKAYKDFQVVR